MFLAFGDAKHFRFVDAVNLVVIRPLLMQHPEQDFHDLFVLIKISGLELRNQVMINFQRDALKPFQGFGLFLDIAGSLGRTQLMLQLFDLAPVGSFE